MKQTLGATLERLGIDVGSRPGFFSFIVVYERPDEVVNFYSSVFFLFDVIS